jgi:hypothetical protein
MGRTQDVSEGMKLSFNYNFESPIDVSEIFGFHMTILPPVKPKYRSLERLFNRDNLSLYEDEQGYHLEYYFEKESPPIDVKLVVLPNIWEPQTKRCEIKVEYIDLRYKIHARKIVVSLANAISSRMSWEHEIVWCTENGHIIEWKNRNEEK